MASTERLQKILAHWGVASRRQAEAMIRAGQVRINGQVAELGAKADPISDHIEVNGQRISACQPGLQTWLLHKPKGVVSTCDDPWGRPTVVDLVPLEPEISTLRLYPIGRLDIDSTGALLLSNDGDLTLHLTHPRYHIPKTYWVQVLGVPDHQILQQWREGVDLEEGLTLPAEVDYAHPLTAARLAGIQSTDSSQSVTTWLMIRMKEGRKRQIRRVAEILGHPVMTLHREAIGSIHLNDLGLGQSRLLSSAELHTLKLESQVDHVS